MTFGIDISTAQRGIDLAQAAREGVQFVIVKAGGLNVTPMYVAPCYAEQIDSAARAGLRKGHYWLIGAGETPEAQAEFFVKNLHGFDVARDVLALDNERLDGNADLWGDSQAARFAQKVIQLTGISPARVWHYAGAHDYRAHVWPLLGAVGVRFWWAAYGGSPTGHTPDHTPDLQGCIPQAHVHQYSSSVRVAGHTVDGNYSALSIDDLFGGTTGGMGGGLSAPASIPAYTPPKPAPKPSRSSNYSSTESDGIPGPQFYKLMQLWAREDGYTGPIDGKPGKNTWAAIQRGRKRWDGYDGPIDGIPGVNTYKALQRAAQHGGYDGPIDGVLGKNSYRGLAKLLNGKFA